MLAGFGGARRPPAVLSRRDAPGWTRTSNPRLRRPALYPVELQGPAGQQSARSARPFGRPRSAYLTALEQKSVKVPAMSPVESDEEDLTRKQRREQAREQRKAMEEAEAAKAVRRTRLTQLGIVAAVVVVAIVVIAIVATAAAARNGPPKEGQRSRSRRRSRRSTRARRASRRAATPSAAQRAGHARLLRRPPVPDLQATSRSARSPR